ncbi:MAG: CapA family protein [Deltaproteobacteria bacterium]|nr:CapA family protein [Deltaproteobacteria bacterium]
MGTRMRLRRQVRLALLALLCAFSAAGHARERRVTLVAVGDVNLNRTRQEVRDDGVYLWGKVVPFDSMFTKVRKLIDGDLNFCNLETTVMDNNDAAPAEKEYNFRCHPNAVRAIQKVGFNLMSIANNHMIDYGDEGISQTRIWLDKLSDERPLWFAGAGKDIEEASDVSVFKVNGVTFAFGAVSISKAATKKRAGVASVHAAEPVLKKLKAAEADVKILSMHAGEEKESKPVAVQTRVARMAVDKFDVDFVIGHHAHVVQGIERRGDGLIFYGLGNFAMRGARNMGSVAEFRGERDFGLLVRLDFGFDRKRRKLTLHRLELVPVYDMHSGPRPFAKEEEARVRIEAVNRFSTAKYLGKGSTGIELSFRDGRGVVEFAKDVDGNKKADAKKKGKKKKSGKKAKDKKSEKPEPLPPLPVSREDNPGPGRSPFVRFVLRKVS